jgi:hypothetical protein
MKLFMKGGVSGKVFIERNRTDSFLAPFYSH